MFFESVLRIGNIIAWLPLEVLEWATKALFLQCSVKRNPKPLNDITSCFAWPVSCNEGLFEETRAA